MFQKIVDNTINKYQWCWLLSVKLLPTTASFPIGIFQGIYVLYTF